MRLVVDQAHLADIVAGLQHRQNDFPPPFIGGDHPRPSGQQDEQRVGLPAGLDHQFAASHAPFDDVVGNALGLLVGQHREQRHSTDELEVGKHGHGEIPLVLRSPGRAASSAVRRR